MKKKILTISRLLSLVLMVTMFFACGDDTKKKEEPLNAAVDETPSGNTSLISATDKGLYVLCEGTYGHFNSAVDFYNTQTQTTLTDAFNQINGLGMGGTANDMLEVDNYIFVAVTDDAMVRVLNKDNMTVYKRFKIVDDNGINRQPRHLVYNNGNVYVSCFDGNVVRINVNQMAITGVVQTKGRNPEGIVINNGKLFVANCGGLSFPNYDKTVSVIDLPAFSVDKTIEVASNPTQLQVFGNYVYSLSMGDYSALPVLSKISASDYTVENTQSIAATEIKIYGNYMYYFYKDYAKNTISLKKMNLNTMQQEEFAVAPEDMKTPYKITVADDIVFITDAVDYVTGGKVFAFDLNGVLLYKFNTSVGPNTVIIKKGISAV